MRPRHSLYALAAYGAGADPHSLCIQLGHHLDLSQVSTLKGTFGCLSQGPKTRRKEMQEHGLD